MEPEQRAFRRNLIIAGVLHVVVITALLLFLRAHEPPKVEQIVWMEPGAFMAEAESVAIQSTNVSNPPVEKIDEAEEAEPMEDEDPLSQAMKPRPTPSPTPTPAPTPTPKPTPEPTRKPEVTPTPTPSTKEKPSPRPTPTPKPSSRPTPTSRPKPSSRPNPSPSSRPKPSAEPTKSGVIAEGTPKSGEPSEDPSKVPSKATSTAAKGTGKSSGGSSTGHGSGSSATASDYGWYFEMIHDRFHGGWDQPKSIFRSDVKFVSTVKIQIERSGEISKVTLVHSSGNAVMDQSVMEAAGKVKRIDALPDGLGQNYFEIQINFELE